MTRAGQPGATSAALDVALAFALVALGQVEAWSGEGGRQAAALAGLATLPLAARRVVPVTVLVICVGALTLLTLRGEDEFTVAQLLGLMLAVYTVAAHRSVRAAVVGLVVALVGALANSAAADGTTGGDFVFPVILLGVPWAAGAALRQWRARTEQLRRLTEELQAEREAHARLAVSVERGRIARDLHDSLAQSLNGVILHAEAAEAALGRHDDRVANSLARIQEVGRASLADTRQLLMALRSDETDADQPRLDQLDRLVDRFREAGLTVTTDIAIGGDDLPAGVESAVYRIVQEGLSNVVRHSHGSRAWVTIRRDGDVEIVIRDDGPGSRAAATPSGLGILGMRERAQLLGGQMTAGPTAEDPATQDPTAPGWTVRARIPVEVKS